MRRLTQGLVHWLLIVGVGVGDDDARLRHVSHDWDLVNLNTNSLRLRLLDHANLRLYNLLIFQSVAQLLRVRFTNFLGSVRKSFHLGSEILSMLMLSILGF
jgi:hypothetical protein